MTKMSRYQLCLPTGPHGSCQFTVIDEEVYDGLGNRLSHQPEPIESSLFALYEVLEGINFDGLHQVDCAMALSETMHDTAAFLRLFHEIIDSGLTYWIRLFNIRLVEMSQTSKINWVAFDEAYAPTHGRNFRGDWSHPPLETVPLKIWGALYQPDSVEPYSIDLECVRDPWIINAGVAMKLFTPDSLGRIPTGAPLGDAFEYQSSEKVYIPSYGVTLRRADRHQKYWEVVHQETQLISTNAGTQSLKWITNVDSLPESDTVFLFKLLKTGCDYDALVLAPERLHLVSHEFSMVAGRFYGAIVKVGIAQREALWRFVDASIVDWVILIETSPSDEFTEWVIEKFGLDQFADDLLEVINVEKSLRALVNKGILALGDAIVRCKRDFRFISDNLDKLTEISPQVAKKISPFGRNWYRSGYQLIGKKADWGEALDQAKKWDAQQTVDAIEAYMASL